MQVKPVLREVSMTGYELFNKVYMHHTGQFIGNLSSNSCKDYAIGSFN